MRKNISELYLPASKKQGGEYEFVKFHRDNTSIVADPNGNDDQYFRATNIKRVDRPQDKHGYNPEQDAAFYDNQPDDEETTVPKVKVNDKTVVRKGANDLKNNRRQIIATEQASLVQRLIALLGDRS